VDLAFAYRRNLQEIKVFLCLPMCWSWHLAH